jgi:hypothetical protein
VPTDRLLNALSADDLLDRVGSGAS